jgi:NitT/TauT family transport system substrate-binding protein
LLIVVGILAVVGFLFIKFKDKIIPDNISKDDNGIFNNSDGDDIITVGVVTWGGYAGGQYFNEGFAASKTSRFYQDYGIQVEFKVIDDFVASRNAWKADEVDLLWTTIDAFTTEVVGLAEYEPQVIFQADWSRGGDAIVVIRGINQVSDLKGKKVAFAEMTPSHTFLLWMLDAGGLTIDDIELVKVASAIDAADLFKKGQVDAAVVWSPDDADCVEKVSGSKVLQSTKDASHIIADVFVCKKAYFEANKDNLKKLYEGWMIGAAEINTSEEAKTKAAKILMEGLSMPEDFCLQAIDNVRLCTNGDNLNFYGLNTSYDGVTGEDIYNKMDVKYQAAGYIDGTITSWRLIANSSLVTSSTLSGTEHEAEGSKEFTAVTETETDNLEVVSTKQVTIQFASGVSTLDDNMKYIIDIEFLDIAKSFANSRIKIEGNTDNTGNVQANIELSKKRAQAVADYLINEHGFDKNRFVVVGNGPNNPVADNTTDDGKAKNRRTDFQLLAE